jgi:hypothetical protein
MPTGAQGARRRVLWTLQDEVKPLLPLWNFRHVEILLNPSHPTKEGMVAERGAKSSEFAHRVAAPFHSQRRIDYAGNHFAREGTRAVAIIAPPPHDAGESRTQVMSAPAMH